MCLTMDKGWEWGYGFLLLLAIMFLGERVEEGLWERVSQRDIPARQNHGDSSHAAQCKDLKAKSKRFHSEVALQKDSSDLCFHDSP